MTNKIYYGEYTLKHWVKLMLAGDIVLPEYQRHFVWKERDVRRLIQSFKDGQFVQPVTIALYNDGIQKHNLILDGQQRLTSILLSYLGYFPDRKKFESADGLRLTSEDDSATEDSIHASDSILWRFSELTHLGKTKANIIDNICRDERYNKLSENLFTNLTDDFFAKTYLGFSYVVPESTTASDVQKNFSQLFRNINYFGKKLEAMDSRKSLYYQNTNLINYFEGTCQDNSDVFSGLTIIEDLQPRKIDFVRYLSILSQFYSSSRDDAKDVMVGYSAYSSRESFYADYVSYIIGIEQEDRIGKFDNFRFEVVFPNDVWKIRMEILRDAISQIKPMILLKDNTSFMSGYEADYWIFGLMYHILFDGKQLSANLTRIRKNGRETTLKNDIQNYISREKKDPSFSKNSNRLSYLRNRIIASCLIYRNYVQ